MDVVMLHLLDPVVTYKQDVCENLARETLSGAVPSCAAPRYFSTAHGAWHTAKFVSTRYATGYLCENFTLSAPYLGYSALVSCFIF